MIRRLTREEIIQSKNQIARIYQEAMGYSEQQGQVLVQRILMSIEKPLNTMIIGAYDNNQMVGFLFGFDFHPDNRWAKQIDECLPKTTYDWYQNTVELNELMVLPSFQSRGFGKAMMSLVIQLNPNSRLLLGTAKEHNEPTIRFYKHLGFKVLIDNFRYDYGYSDKYLILCRE